MTAYFFGDCARGDGDYYLCEVCVAKWTQGTIMKNGASAKLQKYRIKKTVENDIGWDFRVRSLGWTDAVEGERMPNEKTLPVAVWRETAVGWCHSKGFR